jgi:putative transposase
MPRLGRAVVPGYPHHVIQRGNNRENVFFEKEDRTKYLSLLNKYAFKWNAPIMAYCLMSNHIHLLTKPLSEESLFKMMQGLTLCYTQNINRMYGRTGRLWESRYHLCIVDHDKYLWAVARYLEQNPVRAKMVERAEDYSYSSARAHVNGSEDAVLVRQWEGQALHCSICKNSFIWFDKKNSNSYRLIFCSPMATIIMRGGEYYVTIY